MRYFDQLMYEYYRVLNNAWQERVRAAAYQAISWLAELDQEERTQRIIIDKMMVIIAHELGPKFASAVTNQTYAYTERCLRIGLNDVSAQLRSRIAIGTYGVHDAHIANLISQQNLFWIENRFDADIADDFRAVLTDFFAKGWTKAELASALEKAFSDLGTKSAHYWQGLAEHTALRIREFGRLGGYEKAGAQYYALVNPMDDRTSDICLALVGANKIYPLAPALELRDKLMKIDEGAENLETARDRIKALAPFISNKQIEYDSDGNPIGISGAHTPFPPFHWKCRTQTQIVL